MNTNTNTTNKITMNEHDLPYIAYAIGLYLMEYDETFDKESIDDMWNNKVIPWANEFYNSKEYFLVQQPFMDMLNKWLEKKLTEERTHIYEVPIKITINAVVPVQVNDRNHVSEIIEENLMSIIDNRDSSVCDWEYDWEYNEALAEQDDVKSTWDPKEDVLTEEGWRAPSV